MITKIFNIKSIASYNPDSDNIIVEDIDFIIVEDKRILNINTPDSNIVYLSTVLFQNPLENVPNGPGERTRRVCTTN